jgi:uncharacterized transporter YbjL
VVDFFADDSILLVFAVIGVAAALGAVRIKQISLGPAVALQVGLSSGPTFFAGLRRGGLQALAVTGVLIVGLAGRCA